MQHIPVLETRRLALREFTEEHYPHLYRTDADPDVMRYVVPPRTSAQTRGRIEAIRAHCRAFPGLGLRMAFDKTTGLFVGMFSLKYTDAGDEIETGCRLPVEMWGKGYATEGATAMLRHGFRNVRLQRITAFVSPGNQASARVLEKIGLRCEGRKNYNEQEMLYYSIESDRFDGLYPAEHTG